MCSSAAAGVSGDDGRRSRRGGAGSGALPPAAHSSSSQLENGRGAGAEVGVEEGDNGGRRREGAGGEAAKERVGVRGRAAVATAREGDLKCAAARSSCIGRARWRKSGAG